MVSNSPHAIRFSSHIKLTIVGNQTSSINQHNMPLVLELLNMHSIQAQDDFCLSCQSSTQGGLTRCLWLIGSCPRRCCAGWASLCYWVSCSCCSWRCLSSEVQPVLVCLEVVTTCLAQWEGRGKRVGVGEGGVAGNAHNFPGGLHFAFSSWDLCTKSVTRYK